MKSIYFYIILMLLISLPGCEKEYQWELQKDGFEFLVVDALITNELKQQVIKLTITNQDLNLQSVPVTGADISVSDEDNTYYFNEEEPGIYISLPFQAAINNRYRLHIIHNGKEYTANSDVEPVTPLEDLNYALDDDKNMYYYLHADQGRPSMTEIFYNWTSVPAYCGSVGSCFSQETFYVLDNVDVNAVFGPEKQKIYFPAGTEVIRRKYGITEEHQRFLRSLLIETEWRGGVFDVLQGNVPSNISNGALGYFAASTVVADTTVIN